MKLALTAVWMACSAAMTFAQNYVLTNPTDGSKFTANKVAKIMWTAVKNPPIEAVSITIDLVNGNPNAATFVTNIVESLQPTATFFDWKVPGNLPPRNDYFLRMYAIADDTQRSYNYSPKFSILGGDGTSSGGGGGGSGGSAPEPSGGDDDGAVSGPGGQVKKSDASSVAASGALAIFAGAGALLV